MKGKITENEEDIMLDRIKKKKKRMFTNLIVFSANFLSKGNSICLIYLDFSEAFDAVLSENFVWIQKTDNNGRIARQVRKDDTEDRL